MPIVVIQHHPHLPPGRLGDTLRAYGHQLDVRLMHQGQSLPQDLDDVQGIVVLGGDFNPLDQSAHPFMKSELAYLKAAHDATVAIIGVGAGAEVVALALGGQVQPLQRPLTGFQEIKLSFPGTTDVVFAGHPWNAPHFFWLRREISSLPVDSTLLASAPELKNAAFRVGLRTYGFGFHLELTQEALDTWFRHHGLGLNGLNLTAESLEKQARAHFEAHRRLTERINHALAEFILPALQRIET